MYFNAYAIPVITAAILMLALSLLIRTQKSASGGIWFTLLMISGAVYSTFYALEISSAELSHVTVFYRLEYLGIPFIPAFFLLFALSYTKGVRSIRPGLIAMVLTLPVMTSLLAVTFDMHNFFIRGGYIDDQGPFPVFVFTPGFWYWVHQGYTIVFISGSIILFARMRLNVAPGFRRQVTILLTGSLLPFMVYLLYILGVFVKGLDPNPFSFAFAGLVFFTGIYRFGLFTLTPIARNMLFDNIPGGVVVIDKNSRLVDFNRSASAVFGFKTGATGIPVEEALSGWPGILSNIKERTESGSFEIVRRAAGQTLFLDCNFITLTDDMGVERGQMLVANDVTGQRMAELEKHKSEEKFRLVFENAPVGLMYYDKKGIVELCNDYFIRILGSTEEKISGLNLLKLSDRRMVETIKNTLEGKRARFEGKYTSETGNRTIYMKAVFQPVFSENNVFEGGLCIVEDISGRKISEEKVKRTNAELKRLNAEKDRFFSILAHDLRSPFSSFLGYTDILSESLGSMTQEMIHTIVSRMKESANNLYTLLENLLQWSMMQQGSVFYSPEGISVKDKILISTEPLLTFANSKLIDVSYKIPDDIQVFADRKMFDTIIRNLFTNAVKFTPREGSITISAVDAGDDLVEICFRDTGIGMSGEMVENLFRVDMKTSRPGTEGELSTGLGLILCREFLEMHGGTIRVESREGKGSSFYIGMKKYSPG